MAEFNAFADSAPDRWGENMMRPEERERAAKTLSTQACQARDRPDGRRIRNRAAASRPHRLNVPRFCCHNNRNEEHFERASVVIAIDGDDTPARSLAGVARAGDAHRSVDEGFAVDLR
jgi:hypothetical protein